VGLPSDSLRSLVLCGLQAPTTLFFGETSAPIVAQEANTSHPRHLPPKLQLAIGDGPTVDRRAHGRCEKDVSQEVLHGKWDLANECLPHRASKEHRTEEDPREKIEENRGCDREEHVVPPLPFGVPQYLCRTANDDDC